MFGPCVRILAVILVSGSCLFVGWFGLVWFIVVVLCVSVVVVVVVLGLFVGFVFVVVVVFVLLFCCCCCSYCCCCCCCCFHLICFEDYCAYDRITIVSPSKGVSSSVSMRLVS